jgi:multidrug efflux system outer membrane protein
MRKSALLLSAALAACSTQAPYQRPESELPEQWRVTAPANAYPGAEDGRWWRIYADPQLEKVVEEAIASNADLVVAVARVDEAKALLGEASGARYPVVDARLASTRQQNSKSTATFFNGIPTQFSDNRATLNVSYELDLFGRLSSSVEAARAELAASEASRDGVRLALAAQVAKSYFTLRSLDEQVELTRRTVSLRDDALALQRKRYQGGVISEFELRQLEAEAAAVRAQLPPLQRDREREEAALAVLLGRTPRAVFEDNVERRIAVDEAPTAAAVVPEGLPSELLLRRPDLVEAEQRLVATHARIAVARAEMFPSISLTGALGRESASFSDMFIGPSTLWSIGASLAQPIFAGGRLQARTDAARAREAQALAQYRKAIQTAFSEVRAALAAQNRARESYEAQSLRAAALSETLRLARLRYQNGVASQLDVIDAERGLLDAQSARIEALRAHRAAIADLFRALGG